jgi:hypothetical protein
MASNRKRKKAAKKVSPGAVSKRKKTKPSPPPRKTVEGRKTRKLTAEDLGLVNNPNQRIPVVAARPLDVGLEKSRTKFIVVSDDRVVFDQEKAMEYIDLPVFPGERTAGDQHVNHLLDLVHAGEFNWHSVQIASAMLDGKRWKINGQHTAWMIMYLPTSLKPTVRETIYKARDQKELGDIYRTYDTGKGRDAGHQAKVGLVLSEVAPSVPLGKVVQISNFA